MYAFKNYLGNNLQNCNIISAARGSKNAVYSRIYGLDYMLHGSKVSLTVGNVRAVLEAGFGSLS